jgi:uncharacterized protein
MAKKPVKAKVAKKPAKPAKPAAKAKATAPAKATKTAKAGGSATKAKATKPAAKPAPKPVTKAKVAPPKAKVAPPKAKATKPEVKVAAKKAATPAPKAKETATKKVEETKKAAAVAKPVEKPAAVVAEKKVETPAIKTVEQQMQEKEKPAANAVKSIGKKEELFVPKYQLPAPVETFKPMRSKITKAKFVQEVKPVANPIFIATEEGKPAIKFAPMAVIERAPEKEKKNQQEDIEDMKTSPRLAFKDSDDKKGGVNIEAKLRALYDIQLIDTRIDKIHAMRGELPLEVEDLEAEVEGLDTRIVNLAAEVKKMEDEINSRKQGIKDSEGLIAKYKEQLGNVKNNREFDSLNKEVEFQDLEIQLHNKRIKEFQAQKITKEETLATAELKQKERKNDLKIKKNELDEIIKETEKEEKILRKKGEEARTLIEERLLGAYERIRAGAPNKMAVVPIEREASAGSFIQLPPQKQLDVAARRKVIVDEHSGRILVDAELAQEEQEKMDAMLAKELGK